MTFTRKRSAILASVVMIFAATCGTSSAGEKDIVTTAVEAGSFKTLAAALQAADLVEALQAKGPFTVFAPTDEAFAKLPKGTVETLLKPENKKQLIGVLTYHVVKGKVPASKVVKLNGAKTLNGQQVDIKVVDGKVKADNATVIKTDINCSNGVIHVIDRVILPASNNIPTVAVNAKIFNTLVAAVKAAGLAEVLSGKGPFTVFAPTDKAFAKLPKGTVEGLLKPENKDQLIAILKYHVVPGRVYSSDALAAGKAKTLQGGSVSIVTNGKSAMVNDAKLIATDLDASNGVIHVIDSVILPSQKQTAVGARKLIETAIHHGAPLYNAGHAGQCAKVYMSTLRNVLASDEHGMSAKTVDQLHTALKMSEGISCSHTQAWRMRQALEMAYLSIPK